MLGSARLSAVLPSMTSRRLVHSTARIAQRRGLAAGPSSTAVSSGNGVGAVVAAMAPVKWQNCQKSIVTLGTADKKAVVSYDLHHAVTPGTSCGAHPRRDRHRGVRAVRRQGL